MRFTMTDVTPLQGELQTQIMAAIWRLDEGTVEQVRQALPSHHQGAYNTVQTVLNRLAERSDGVPGDLVVRGARPLGERAQQVAGVKQHERAGQGTHDDEGAQPERGRPHEAGGGRVGTLEREQVRKDDPYGRDGGDERRDGHRIRSTATSSASRPSSAASPRGRLPMSCAMATCRASDDAPRSVCSMERERYSASVSDGA